MKAEDDAAFMALLDEVAAVLAPEQNNNVSSINELTPSSASVAGATSANGSADDSQLWIPAPALPRFGRLRNVLFQPKLERAEHDGESPVYQVVFDLDGTLLVSFDYIDCVKEAITYGVNLSQLPEFACFGTAPLRHNYILYPDFMPAMMTWLVRHHQVGFITAGAYPRPYLQAMIALVFKHEALAHSNFPYFNRLDVSSSDFTDFMRANAHLCQLPPRVQQLYYLRQQFPKHSNITPSLLMVDDRSDYFAAAKQHNIDCIHAAAEGHADMIRYLNLNRAGIQPKQLRHLIELASKTGLHVAALQYKAKLDCGVKNLDDQYHPHDLSAIQGYLNSEVLALWTDYQQLAAFAKPPDQTRKVL